MARKSNKTAHVLNLIAGHEGQQETAGETNASTESPASPAASAVLPAPGPSVNTPPQNISVIDTTTEDPVADLIQQQLTSQFDESKTADAKQEPRPEPQPEPIAEPEQLAEPQPETDSQPEPIAEPEQLAEPQPETIAEPEPEIALEPDFARVNVMEAIVNDKIIYFMRQFDVCTCERCVADTCALTLSGLLPKYIVTTPAAVDPLLSFYTNRYISDVTVEATKACMIVKDNPRH